MINTRGDTEPWRHVCILHNFVCLSAQCISWSTKSWVYFSFRLLNSTKFQKGHLTCINMLIFNADHIYTVFTVFTVYVWYPLKISGPFCTSGALHSLAGCCSGFFGASATMAEGPDFVAADGRGILLLIHVDGVFQLYDWFNTCGLRPVETPACCSMMISLLLSVNG